MFRTTVTGKVEDSALGAGDIFGEFQNGKGLTQGESSR